jgi:streptomycin 6-kinase
VAQPHLTDWLRGVPPLVAELAERWRLSIGDAYIGGAGGYVVRAERADGTPAVLKVGFPHREGEQEAAALERWDGDGAVRLLERDDDRSALLLERCEPGTFLSQSPSALDVLVGLLPRLWKDAAGFHTLTEEISYWSFDTGRDAELTDAARSLATELGPTQSELVLVHQDLHGDNVLSAEREPWLVIDPKPLAAEREFAVAPIVRSPELGHSKREVLYRLDRLCSDLALDRERAAGWTIVQTVAWSGGSDYVPTHVEAARWLLE